MRRICPKGHSSSDLDYCSECGVAIPLQLNVTIDDDLKESASHNNNAPPLQLKIVVDPTLYTEPEEDIDCPIDAPEKIYKLELDKNTLGRHFEVKGIHPEIVIKDPGISRRHLKFDKNDEGFFEVQELGSANGTLLNNAPLKTDVPVVIKSGDQLTLGMWTRIFVQVQ